MKFILLLVAVALTGCASPEYAQYAKTQESIAISKSNAEISRHKALSEIAANGDSTSKVAAVMALALGSGKGTETVSVAPPPPNQALQWASILIPGLTQVYGIKANAEVAMRSSDNAAATSVATTNGFVSIAGKIQGSGATYNVSGNSGTNSGNATATPTVVNQPTPIVVAAPDPVIVTQPDPVVVNPSYPPFVSVTP